ncbi:hypothetical protein C798_19490 [Herbaspirillum rubrisubalbicans Os34]|uniref:Uncharacterized protein n=1 Tax=Herbaspirillum rubrisubalbicans Os34 TaxID=1235827 RepID=A0A6M3ZVE6_9BURK|nr:hypothetical protein C798_19490 [Herbaspirillum rubrisubalbicans Os34]
MQHGFDPNLEGDYPFPILGSLGLDFLGQIGFVLDYPEQRIFFLSENELNLLKADHPGVFHPFSYGDEESMKQINFRLQLDDQEMTAIFDTASSMFELILPPKAWESHTQTTFLEAERQVAIPAWGKMINIYGQSCHSKALLAGKEFPISECFSWPDFSWKPIIGNKPFLENIVVFDLRYLAYAIF